MMRSLLLLCVVGFSLTSDAQKLAVTSLRVYLFDCGLIHGENPLEYGLKAGEVANPDMIVPCYLIVHPKGTLMWDVGVIPDSAFHGEGPVKVVDGNEYETSPRPLLPRTSCATLPS